jgi:hypothetical protein
MTVKEAIEKLRELPEDVVLCGFDAWSDDPDSLYSEIGFITTVDTNYWPVDGTLKRGKVVVVS